MSDGAFKEIQAPAAPPSPALYIHVPFCLRKCRYCDFYSVPLGESSAEPYLEAIGQELRCRRGELADELDTVFLGGGTPSLLGAPGLGQVIDLFAERLTGSTEFSMEMNPSTFAAELGDVFERGVNRVSIGVQSFVDDELRTLGRIHSADEARRCVDAVRRCGAANTGLDLMYGIPGQTMDTWLASLEAAMALEPSHLSCYALSIEEGTPLAADVEAGRVVPAEDDLHRKMYDLAIERLEAGGLAQYELSNFARRGQECRHNLRYWRNESYVGIGPAAASFVSGVRSVNVSDLAGYIGRLAAGGSACEHCEQLTGQAAGAEALMLGLRLVGGVDRHSFARRYGRDPVEAFPESLSRHAGAGAVRITPASVAVERAFFFVINTVLVDILAEADDTGVR